YGGVPDVPLEEGPQFCDALEDIADPLFWDARMLEDGPVEFVRRASDQRAPFLCDLDQGGPAVLRMGATTCEARGLEAIDGVRRRGRVHLQPLGDLVHRETPAAGEGQKGQHLIPGEREGQWTQHPVDS